MTLKKVGKGKCLPNAAFLPCTQASSATEQPAPKGSSKAQAHAALWPLHLPRVTEAAHLSSGQSSPGLGVSKRAGAAAGSLDRPT